jgi:hypothetical protein
MPLTFFLYALVAAAIGVLIGLLLRRLVMGDRLDEPPEQTAARKAQPLNPAVEPSGQAVPSAPIELRLARPTTQSALCWTVVLAVGAIVLFNDPVLLGMRWLGWMAGGAMALLVPVAAAFAWSDWRSRLTASPSGLVWHNGLSVQQRVKWTEVGAVRLVEQWVKDSGSIGFNQGSSPARNYMSRQQIVVLDRQGQPLMEFDEPLRPPEAYRLFLDAVPGWSGIAITRGKTENGVAVAP